MGAFSHSDGGACKTFPPFKGGPKKFYPVLKGGGAKSFRPAIFPFCSPPPRNALGHDMRPSILQRLTTHSFDL